MPKGIGFDEDTFLLQPRKKVPFRAVEFDVTKAAVAKDMTSDTDLRLILALDAGG